MGDARYYTGGQKLVMNNYKCGLQPEQTVSGLIDLGCRGRDVSLISHYASQYEILIVSNLST